MTKNIDRKSIAKDKLHIAIENFKQAELEGAEELTPLTYRAAKNKIYESRKIILNLHSNSQTVEEAADDASAASAQLLSAVRNRETEGDKEMFPIPELIEKESVDNLINEGGPAT